ncbi:MAG: 50S ribosomal protein L9 [Anaerolineae bacterium]|nr:50S ribosomal protein L9 [Anaerolineae bacterium]NUQ03998.1 50S ribosomal protein L9 [Anaerolineae bacterium]
MKVILTSDVYKHGVAGEIISVADGFARNWLLPQGLAKKANPGALRELDNLRSQAAARKAALEERLNELARLIDGTELFFARRASPTGKLFGSVTTGEIAAELNRVTGIDINRRRISQTALREVGTHNVPIRLGSETSPHIKVVIVREEQFNDFMAARALTAQAASAGDEPPDAPPSGDEGDSVVMMDDDPGAPQQDSAAQ